MRHKIAHQPRIGGHQRSLNQFVAASLKDLTAKTFTLLEAFIALTFTTLPNIERVPAGVAAFCFILSVARPGMVNFPDFLHSATPMSLRAERQLFTSFAFSPVFSATITVTAPAVIDLADTDFFFITAFLFITFIAPM